MNVLVLGDTHVPDHAPRLPAELEPHLDWAELILHAGDITSTDVLTELEAHAPVRAVLGNIDGWDVAAAGVPEEQRFDLDGVAVAMVHDSGARQGREARLRRRFPEARVIIFGHSHQPVLERQDGVLLLNAGSPTWKRRAPTRTVIRLTIAGGRVDAVLVDL